MSKIDDLIEDYIGETDKSTVEFKTKLHKIFAEEYDRMYLHHEQIMGVVSANSLLINIFHAK
jgi:hypothetical protein